MSKNNLIGKNNLTNNIDVRAWLDDTLSSWLSTWDDLPDDEYPTFLSDIIKSLRHLNSPKLTREAYEEILFHLWQIYGQDDD